MPIYEYACAGCRKKVSIFQRGFTPATAVRCPECGGEDLSRAISTFAFRRSVEFDDAGGFDDMMGDFDEDDPASVARMARQMSQQMGGDMPPGFEDELARMEAGEMPGDDGFGGGDDDWDM
jgi:putative FmdB family regulatory protein